LAVGFGPLVAAFALSGSLLAQDAAPPPADAGPASADTGNANGRGRRGNFSPEAAMAAAKEQFGVTDDAEWSLISARIMAVMDLRRSTGGFGGGFLRMGGGGGGFRGNGGGRTANPELDALRTAVTDKMPDAEIKARLDHYREVRKDNEAKLAKAQEDLRAVLTVRQEAMAVMAGLLP
jgi:hypothetical protein